MGGPPGRTADRDGRPRRAQHLLRTFPPVSDLPLTVTQEAKLEFPFLQIGTKSTTTVTFKQHLNFSSSLMSYSASIINGLSTSRDEFQVERKDGRERFEVKGWLVVEELAFDESRSEGAGWSIQETREQMQGWWIGPKSGSKLSCVSLAFPSDPCTNSVISSTPPLLPFRSISPVYESRSISHFTFVSPIRSSNRLSLLIRVR